MGKIFVCYRHNDTQALTTRLYDRLGAIFRDSNVFMDSPSIKGGDNFQARIEENIQNCKIQLVVIGTKWLGGSDDTGSKRIDHPDDLVRREVELALSHGVTLLPLLAEGIHMPSEEELPDSIRSLRHMQALKLSSSYFDVDMEKIVAVIKEYVDPRVPRYLRAVLGAVLALLVEVAAVLFALPLLNVPIHITLANWLALAGFVISIPFWIVSLIECVRRQQWLWFGGVILTGALAYYLAYVIGGLFYFLPVCAPLIFGLLGSTRNLGLQSRHVSRKPAVD